MKTMNEAMLDSLLLLSAVSTARRRIDDKLVTAYLWVIAQDRGLLPADIENAAQHLGRNGEGMFPPGPVFRRECLQQKHIRERKEGADRFALNKELQGDLLADEHDPIPTKEEAHAIFNAAASRMLAKMTAPPRGRGGNP